MVRKGICADKALAESHVIRGSLAVLDVHTMRLESVFTFSV